MEGGQHLLVECQRVQLVDPWRWIYIQPFKEINSYWIKEKDLETCQIEEIPFEVQRFAVSVLSQELHCPQLTRQKLSSRFLNKRSSFVSFDFAKILLQNPTEG